MFAGGATKKRDRRKSHRQTRRILMRGRRTRSAASGSGPCRWGGGAKKNVVGYHLLSTSSVASSTNA
jgi:hypothetical protein